MMQPLDLTARMQAVIRQHCVSQKPAHMLEGWGHMQFPGDTLSCSAWLSSIWQAMWLVASLAMTCNAWDMQAFRLQFQCHSPFPAVRCQGCPCIEHLWQFIDAFLCLNVMWCGVNRGMDDKFNGICILKWSNLICWPWMYKQTGTRLSIWLQSFFKMDTKCVLCMKSAYTNVYLGANAYKICTWGKMCDWMHAKLMENV